jgi:hypothetical protein
MNTAAGALDDHERQEAEEAALEPPDPDPRAPHPDVLDSAGRSAGLITHIDTGPFSLFFTNINTEMRLAGHSHFARLTLTWLTLSSRGFPSFEATHHVIQEEIKEFTRRPFRNYTNERVALALFQHFYHWGPSSSPELARWGGTYRLECLLLEVRGVPDRIGHADAYTAYRVARRS